MRTRTPIRSLLFSAIALGLTATAAYAEEGQGNTGSVHGTYVGTGSGSALFALCGFDANGIPRKADLGLYETLLANTESRFVLNPDGTGTIEVLVHVIGLPNAVIDPAYGEPLRFPWYGDEAIKGQISYQLDQRTGVMQISDVSTSQEWLSGPLKGVTNTANFPLATGRAILSDDRKSLKFTASGIPLTLNNVTLPACGTGNHAQVVAHISSMAIRQNQAPSLLGR